MPELKNVINCAHSALADIETTDDAVTLIMVNEPLYAEAIYRASAGDPELERAYQLVHSFYRDLKVSSAAMLHDRQFAAFDIYDKAFIDHVKTGSRLLGDSLLMSCVGLIFRGKETDSFVLQDNWKKVMRQRLGWVVSVDRREMSGFYSDWAADDGNPYASYILAAAVYLSDYDLPLSNSQPSPAQLAAHQQRLAQEEAAVNRGPSVPQGTVGAAPYTQPIQGMSAGYTQKSKLVAGLLSIFLGGFGAGRFYLGYIGIGFAQIAATLFTFGVGALWGVVEGIMILTGNIPVDKNGIPLKD
jgi:TM2 domain-containing membrane protein YozV